MKLTINLINMKTIIERLEQIGIELDKKFRSEGYEIRCKLYDIRKELEAINFTDSSTLLKERQKTIFKLNDALKKIEEDEDFFLDQEVEWNKQKSFIEGKINALTNL